jgi:hypothetical protein
VVRDFRIPRPTRGSDYVMPITLADPSCEEGLQVMMYHLHVIIITNSGLTEIYLRLEIPILILMAWSRYIKPDRIDTA